MTAITANQFPNLPVQDYLQIRPMLRTGDILLCASNQWLSSPISIGTQSPWTHVGLVVVLDKPKKVLLLESTASQGCRAVPLSHYMQNYNGEAGKSYPGGLVVARHHQPLDSPQQAEMTHKGMSLLGSKYDWCEIMGIAARILAQRLLRQSIQARAIDDKYICSEFVEYCFRAAGIQLNYNAKGFISPKDFNQTNGFNCLAVLQAKP